MKGSHRVESFLNWVENHPNLTAYTKISLKRKVKMMADKCSAAGKQGRLDLKQPMQFGGDVLSIRVFEDGSLTLGMPDNLKWYGSDLPALIPPSEEDI